MTLIEDLYSITGGGSRKIEYLDDSGVRCTQCKTYIDHYDEIDELRYYHCPNCFFNWRSFYLPKPQASTQSQVIQQTAQHVLEPDQSVKRESEIRPSDSVGEHHHHESQKAKVALDTDSVNQSTSQKSESEAVVQSGEAVVQSASSTRICEADIRAAPAAKQTPSVNHDHHSPIQRSSTNEYEERKAAAREKRLLRFHMKPYTPANLSDAVTSSGRVYSATKDCDEPTEPDDDGLLERKRASALAALHKIPTKPEDKAAMTRSSREASNVVVPEESVASNRTGVTAINDRLDNWAFSAPLDDWVINIPEVSSPPSSSSTSTARQQASTNDRKRYRSKSPSYTGSRHQPSSRHRNDGQSEGGRRDSRRPGSVAASSNVRYGRNDPRDYNRNGTSSGRGREQQRHGNREPNAIEQYRSTTSSIRGRRHERQGNRQKKGSQYSRPHQARHDDYDPGRYISKQESEVKERWEVEKELREQRERDSRRR